MTMKKTSAHKNYMSIGFRCRQQSPQPAKAALGFDRNEARNPQMHIVPTVLALGATCPPAGIKILAES
jgi:hypothetical protein